MRGKRLVATTIVVLVLAGLAYLQFRTWTGFDWAAFRSQFRSLDPSRIASAVLLIFFTYYLRAVRWKLMLRPSVPDARVADLVSGQVIGFSAVALLGRPGEVIRPLFIARKFGLSVSSQIAVLAVERVFDMACFAILLIANVLLFDVRVADPDLLRNFRAAGLLLGVLVLGFAGLLFFIWREGEHMAAWVHRRMDHTTPRMAAIIAQKIRTFSDGLHTLRDARSFLEVFGLSMAIWVVIALAYVQVTRAYPAELHFLSVPEVLLVMSASIAGSLLQLPLVGGGSQLGTISVLEHVFAIRRELAASAGLMMWLVTFFAVAPVGLIWARIEHVNLRKLDNEESTTP